MFFLLPINVDTGWPNGVGGVRRVREGEVLMGGYPYNLLKDHVGRRAAFMINLFAMLFLTMGFFALSGDSYNPDLGQAHVLLRCRKATTAVVEIELSVSV